MQLKNCLMRHSKHWIWKAPILKSALTAKRHKILLALQDMIDSTPVILEQVAELDETFVLECYKGKELPPDVDRPARKHGAKAQKRGISNEYICNRRRQDERNHIWLKSLTGRMDKKQATEKVKWKQERFPDQAPAYSFKIIFHSSVLQYSRSMR